MRPALKLKQLLADSETPMDENWMVSYIDVFVLMTTLFVLLLFLQSFCSDPDLVSDPVDIPDASLNTLT